MIIPRHSYQPIQLPERRIVFRALLLAALLTVCAGSHAIAFQSTGAAAIRQQEAQRALESARAATLSRQRLEDSLELLEIETRRSLSPRQSSQPEFSSRDTVNHFAPAPSGSSKKDDWGVIGEPSAAGHDQQMPFSPETRDIYERIDLLKKIYRQRRIEAKLENQTPQSPPKTMRQVGTVSDARAQAPPKDTALAEPTAETQDEMLAEDPSLEPMTPAASKNRQVLSEPVDAFEMGNSLFQTGRVETALRAYDSVDQSKITAFDSTWLEFMMATCKRRLGKTEEAIGTYRRIANEKNSGSLVKASRWWLKHLENSEKNLATFKEMQAKIDNVTERVNSYGKQ